jgi:Domain of unknown function (DUF4091)/Family of unknown function (DUF6067)
VLVLGALSVALGIKIVKKVHRLYNKPKLFDTRKLVSELKGPNIDENLKIFAASSLDRIFLDGKSLLKPSFSRDVSITAAGNEYESFQIVILSKDKDLTGVSFEISDLQNLKTGSKISQENITWRVVGYVPTQKPYYPVKFVGLWPDPLMPVKSYDIKASTTQPFWLTVYVPSQSLAGDYTGTVTIKGQGLALHTILVHLHVYGFSLSKKSHLKTAFDFYGHLTNVQYPSLENESDEAWHARLDALNEQFTIAMLSFRMNPILNVDPTLPFELEKVYNYLPLGLNNFSVGKKGGTFDNNWPKDDESIENLLPLYREYGEVLKLNNLLFDTYIYTWDEGEIGNPLIPKLTSMIHRAYPGLKNMVCYHGLWDPQQNPDWGKDIDIWTFNIDNFDQNKILALQKMGMEVWMYVSGPSGNDSPNLALDFDSIDYRIIPWICWKYDIRGFLYWCVNWWPNVNPFKDAKNSEWEQNGNGLLFYPGPDGPIASIRAEIFRDGMEDYEYIQILMEKLRILKHKNFNKSHKKIYDESIRLLTMDPSIILSPTKFVRDGQVLMSRRNEIAEMIEKIDLAEPTDK